MVREILKIKTDKGLGKDDPFFKGIELTEYSAKFPRMGMPTLSATLKWTKPLDDEWTRKEYVTLRDHRFYIRHTPSGKIDHGDGRYVHELEFVSEFAEILGNTYFVDAVPGAESSTTSISADRPCTNSTTFKFYGTIAEFCDRLNCAFLYAGIGDGVLSGKTHLTTSDAPLGNGYCAVIDPFGDYDPDKSYEFSFEDKSFWEAITYGYDVTKIPFERRGRAFVFGAVPTVVEHKFEYGHNNELLSVYHKNANAKVINRITMLGSSENIPHYYPNETEYGHISLAVRSGNKTLTTGMLEIANMTQLLSRLNAGEYAELCKRKQGVTGSADAQIYGYAHAFANGPFVTYTTESEETYYHAGFSGEYVLWHIRVFFEMKSAGAVVCPAIQGNVWKSTDTTPNGNIDLMEDATPEALEPLGNYTQGAIGVDYFTAVEKKDGTIRLGSLPKGKYFFQFSVKVPNCPIDNNTHYDGIGRISKVELKAAPASASGYYWKAGGKEYDGLSSLGVRITAEITDDMVGDGFGWEASERMSFQERLMPPKYRSTLGAERFYKAINGTYTDPDTDTGGKYTFPNPFVDGSPCEHIYRDEEIKPTIEGITNASGQFFGVIADIAYDEDDNDVLKPDSSEDGDKNDPLKYEHSFFYIKLNIFNGDYGFDLFAHASQTAPMTIQMASGPCNGCKFKIQAAKFTDENGLESYKNPIIVKDGKANGVVSETGLKESDLDSTQQNTQTHSIWVCVQKDAETFGVIMPNKEHAYKPRVGDTFNIINIDLPQAYILAAEKRLEEDGIRFMADNNEEKFTFDIQASRIFFAENPDVLAQLDEYSVIRVTYNGKEYEQYVNQLTIDCKDNEALPNIGVELTDTLSVGQSFVENVAERAASLVARSSYLGAGGMNSALSEMRYLNKQRNDRTPFALSVGGWLTAETGAHFGDFVQGRFTGRGAAIDAAGNGEFESVIVRGSIRVMELIYNRLNAQEGNTSFADSGTIEFIISASSISCLAQLRRRWEGDFTAFQPGDIVYGYVNNLGNPHEKEYYKSWGWIRDVDRGTNQISLVLYPDSEVPEGKNHPPAEGMMITRWGNMIEANEATYNNSNYSSFIGRRETIVTNDDGSESIVYEYYNKRQSSFYVSCEDGNIVELMGVNKPILERYNYGTILGAIPDGLLDETTQELINPNHPYLFARGIIVQDLIRIDYEGVPTRTANYRGVWDPYTAASETEYYRSVDTTYDVVTWDGALWQCVVSHADNEEPGDLSSSWVKMTAGLNDNELRIWTIIPSSNFVSVRSNSVVPSVLSASVMFNSSIYPPTVFTSNYALSEEGVQLYYSIDGVLWQIFVIGEQEPLDLEDDSGVIELEDSVDDSKILTVGGDDIDTDTIGDRIYFELRTVPEEDSGEVPKVLSIVQIPVIRDGKKGAFQSTVFLRTNEEPETPTGGTYDSPVPTSQPQWSDGIPEGEEILWATTRVFDLNIDTTWEPPRQMTDTATYDVEFSNVDEDPGTPSTKPANWFDPDTDKGKPNVDFAKMLWRAERQKKNGVWSDWTIVRIKGEKGAIQSTVFLRTNEEPETPTGGTYDSPVPTSQPQWSNSIPEGEEILWATTRIFEEHAEEETEWEPPRQMTDTATYDVEFSNVDEDPGTPSTKPANWFDPDTDKGKVDFTKMVWRAERVKKNGLWGAWTIVRIKGARGPFQSTVFIRTNTEPARPTGGTYDSPVPTSQPQWSDSIPEGEEILWASTRTFDDNIDTIWDAPRQMTDTETFDVEFSNVEVDPGTPNTKPYNWFDPVEDKGKVDFTSMVWRGERIKKNGEWGDWVVIWIKGEKGDPGAAGDWTSYVFKKSETKPDIPTGSSVVPTGWQDAPDSVGTWWMSMATIDGVMGVAGQWSDPIKVTGEDGVDGPYTDFKYLDSPEGDNVTLSDAGKATRHPSGWEDNPPALSEGYALWMIQAEINADNTLKTNWSDPVRISGEKGAEGDPGSHTEFRYKSELSGVSPDNPSQVPEPEGWQLTPPSRPPGYVLWMIQAQKDHDGNLIGQWSVPVRISGDKGDRGTEGLMVYPAGFYDKNTVYLSDEETMPVVMYGDEDNYNYYRLKAGKVYQGHLMPSDRDTPAKDVAKDDAQTVWVLFDKFDSVFANIIMANFAKLGAAVFYGDWMISQQGLLNGQHSSQYQYFKDESNPFDPYFAVNYETGEVWAEKGYFKGRIEAESGTFAGGIITRFKKLADSDAVYKSSTSSYALKKDLKVIVGSDTTVELPTDISYAGARAMICNNQKTYSRVPPPSIIVEGNGCIYGLHGHDAEDAPTSGAYTIKGISFLTGVVELTAVPNDDGTACDWFVIGNNSYYSDYQ